jgi:NAD(P)H-hydrate repair Nnr-like enzyme with NAD(P)H-hydrate dehydratase domain
MLLIFGTVPVEGLSLTIGTVEKDGNYLSIGGHRVPRSQGTGTSIGAALATTEYLGLEPPQALIAGDDGKGNGSKEIHQYLIEHVEKLAPEVLLLHYCLPNMALTRKLCAAIGDMPERPVMIADAASMYAAKAAGLAGEFDILTPDASEMAFLADPDASHPAYINRHLFNADISRTPELAAGAYRQNDVSGLLLVKGSTDYIIREGAVLATVGKPDVPELEAIGGTGDTISGMVAAFMYAGLEPHEAAIIAARANRTAGRSIGATPATKVSEIIDSYPAVFRENLCEWSGVCYVKGEFDND